MDKQKLIDEMKENNSGYFFFNDCLWFAGQEGITFYGKTEYLPYLECPYITDEEYDSARDIINDNVTEDTIRVSDEIINMVKFGCDPVTRYYIWAPKGVPKEKPYYYESLVELLNENIEGDFESWEEFSYSILYQMVDQVRPEDLLWR